MAGLISYTTSLFASLLTPFLQLMRTSLSFFYNESREMIRNDISNDISADDSKETSPAPEASYGSGSGIPDDLLSSGPGRDLILFVDANEKKLAHLLFVTLTKSGFHIVINHTTRDLPLALRRSKDFRQKERHSLQIAIEENKDFLKDRPFKLLLTSIPLFLHLLNSDRNGFLKGLSFTLAYVGKDERSHLPNILSENKIFNSA